MLPPDAYGPKPWWAGQATRQWRESAFLVDGGGVVFDWDLRTTLEGLYAAGVQLAGGADHAASACHRPLRRPQGSRVRRGPRGRRGRPAPRSTTEKSNGSMPRSEAHRRRGMEGTAGRSLPGHAGLLRRVPQRGDPEPGPGMAGRHPPERAGPGSRPQPARAHAHARVRRAADGGREHDARVAGPQGQQRGAVLQAAGLPRPGPA